MKSKLLSGLSEEEKKHVTREFNSSVSYRGKVKALLEDEIKALYDSMGDESNWETPNWSLLQADRLAQIKALKKVISLFL